MKSLQNRVGRWVYVFVDPYGITAFSWIGYPDPDGRAKIIIPLLSVSPFNGHDFLCEDTLLEYVVHTCPWFFAWPWMWWVQYFWHYSLCLFFDLGPHTYDIYPGFVAVWSSLLRPIVQEGDKVLRHLLVSCRNNDLDDHCQDCWFCDVISRSCRSL